MSAEEKFLVPRPGLIVRDPRSKMPLSEMGDVKPWTGSEGRYWRRRANDGDIIVYDEKPITEAVYDRKNLKTGGHDK